MIWKLFLLRLTGDCVQLEHITNDVGLALIVVALGGRCNARLLLHHLPVAGSAGPGYTSSPPVMGYPPQSVSTLLS